VEIGIFFPLVFEPLEKANWLILMLESGFAPPLHKHVTHFPLPIVRGYVYICITVNDLAVFTGVAQVTSTFLSTSNLIPVAVRAERGELTSCWC